MKISINASKNISSIDYSICNYVLNGVSFLKTVNSSLFIQKTELLTTAADNTLLSGSISINNTTKVATISGGGIMNRSGSYVILGGQTYGFSGITNGNYILLVHKTTGVLTHLLYNSNISSSYFDYFTLMRFNITGYVGGTGGNFAVDYSICNYVIDGTNYYITTDVNSSNTITALNGTVIAADNVLFNGTIDVNNTTKLISFGAGTGGVISRGAGYVSIGSNTYNFSATTNGEYGLYSDRVTGALSVASYTSNVSSTFKSNYCLMRFSITSNVITKVTYSICDYLLDGIKYIKYASADMASPRITSKTYCEIGDSISWQFDGKKENFASQYSGATGYLGTNGYGQLIRKVFGISYDNHKSHGLNGRTFSGYIREITYPANGDLVWNVPKDADIYTIFLGTNDWGTNQTLGTESDYLNNTFNISANTNATVYGGIRRLVDWVTDTGDTRDKKIVFITPIGFGAYTGYGGTVKSTWSYDGSGKIIETTNSAGVKMSDIVTAIKFAANQIGAYVIDLYNENGIVQKNRLNIAGAVNGSGVPLVYQGVLGDNLHPNTKGHLWMGRFLTTELQKIIVTDGFN